LAQTEAVRPLDAGWLWLESDTNLMHGSFLAVFDSPADRGSDFVDRLAEQMATHTVPTPPFDRRLKPGWSARLRPRWEIVGEIDPARHLRRSTLPAPGGQRELGELVSNLHGTALDHERPPWRVDLIDGLEGGRFAVLGRMHHALVDGVAAVRIVSYWLSEDPDEREMPPIWAYRRPSLGTAGHGAAGDGRASTARALPGALLGALPAGARAARNAITGVSARPWSAPRSTLNTPISARRRVSTRSYELARFRALADRSGGTINDVVLAVCAGALRRYLSQTDNLPARSLVTNIPVSLRSREEDGEGNRISWAMLALATDVADPGERLATIIAASSAAKRRLSEMPGGAIDAYTLLAVTPILLEQLSRVGGRVPPLFNVPISNVPGPRKPLHLNGARLEEIQALTVIYGGYGLNIVTLSYAEKLDFAFTACADTVPHSQRLAVYSDDALAELEDALNGRGVSD
jgi:WS/DGAT/MGAT family acyltransferase